MALTDTKLQRLPTKERPYQLADGGGLFVAVHPTGKKVWRLQYRLGGRAGQNAACCAARRWSPAGNPSRSLTATTATVTATS